MTHTSGYELIWFTDLSDFSIYGLEVYDDFLPALSVHKDLRRISSTKIKATAASKKEKLCVKRIQAFVLVISRMNYLLRFTLQLSTRVCVCISPITFYDTHIQFILFGMQFDFLTLDWTEH